MSQTASTDEGHLTENASGDPVIKRYSPQLPELLDNPYAVNAYYREHDPVHWGTSTYSWLPGMWYLFRHRDNARVLKMTAERPPSLGAVPAKAGLAEGGLSLGLSQKTPLSPDVIDLLRRLWQNLLGQKDAPEHTRARKVMNDFFHRRKIEPRRQRVQDVVDWLFDRAEAKGTGRIELVSETTLLLPVFTTLEIMGLPTEDRDLVKNWSDGLVTALVSGGSADDFKIGAEAIANLFDYFENELADRRKNPADDLITQLMRAENDKELTHDEVLASCAIMILGGHETTTSLLGVGTLGLLQQRERFEQIRTSPTLVPVAVEELLRWVTPAHAVRPRYVYRDTEIGGKTIKRGEVVYPLLAAANWDPGVFPDPHRIDFTRGPEAMRSVLAFGGGIHNCVGAPVARLEAELYLATLARRFPNLDLEHGYRPQYRPNYCWRSLAELPVVY